MSTKESSTLQPPATTQDFPIIGIGASAGGLDAFRQFLNALPENSGMAYVFVQHLYPSHESILPEILSRYTNIPVLEITDDIHLAPNHIYVIPENQLLTSIDGVLKLYPREKESRNAAIDIFFVSLAEVHLTLAVGIVLSGMGTDGTLGLKAIKKHGGTTFAQTPDSAGYSQMPLSAINAESTDYVMTAGEMPAKLMALQLEKDSHVIKDPAADEENAFHEIIVLLRKKHNVDFTYYKQSTIRRRIERRMAITKTENFAEYLQFLSKEPNAVAVLFNDLLIPVTTFFRDSPVFSDIKERLIPAVNEGKKEGDAIRIWIAGCSTGQEVYSLAMALSEFEEAQATGRQIQVFASDISEASLATARKGFYKEDQLANVPEGLRTKYFDQKENGYQIKKKLRDLCVFALHNFLKDPPFARMDLISCRNVLIYMSPVIQKKALTTFHYALSDTGFLLLGKSETSAPAEELFIPFLKTSRVYTKKTAVGRNIHKAMRENEAPIKKPENNQPESTLLKTNFLESAQAVLLSDFTPPSVIINEQLDIVHVNGNIVPFLELAQGKPTFNVLKIARTGLAYELRNAIRKAKEGNSTVIKQGIPIKFNGEIIDTTIEIRPLKCNAEPYFLIVFKHIVVTEKGNTKFISIIHDQINNDNVNLKRISLLEKELLQTHTDVNAITEQQDASNEELQSANEELLSGSEELQSLNEELETSKEELQSSNEELIIINAELLEKQELINISKNYIEAIVATLREPIVVLDQDLRIKNVNRAFVKKYGIAKELVKAKLIYEILDNLFEDTMMRSMLEKVLPQNIEVDDYEITLKADSCYECVLLINARQVTNEHSKEQLILLAIEDITDRKVTERSLKALSDGLEAKVKERTTELEKSNIERGISIRELNSANIRLQQFAYVASHDLQEPLRKIQTFISILQQRDMPAEAMWYLEKINNSSDRMKTLIQDLVTYSYLADDEALFVKTDLNNTIKNILIDLELLIEQKNIRVTCGNLPSLNAIPLQMNQLFYNLVSNAIKFIPNDNTDPRIEILCNKLSAAELTKYPEIDGSLVWYDITVRDNGIGFEQKFEKQIYTIFQRLNNNDLYKGTGIGLAISYKIVENHGGIIFATSQLNEGAVFHVLLHA